MRPSSLFRTFSLRIPSRLTAPVVPWPVRTRLDRRLSSEIEALRRKADRPDGCFTTSWLLEALEVAVSTQKLTVESVAAAGSQLGGSRKMIDEYLDDVVGLLDTCNGLRGMMDSIREYVESLRIALHFSEGEPTTAALRRVQLALDSCTVTEKRCMELDKCGSTLRRLGEKLAEGAIRATCGGKPSIYSAVDGTGEPEIYEALCASKAVALLVCGALVISLSFKSNRGLPATQFRPAMSWCSSLQELNKEIKEEIEKRRRKTGGAIVNELGMVVETARDFKDLIFRWPENKTRQVELRDTVEDLGRRCEELEKDIKMFERGVDELYRLLISIRMALLDILTELM